MPREHAHSVELSCGQPDGSISRSVQPTPFLAKLCGLQQARRDQGGPRREQETETHLGPGAKLLAERPRDAAFAGSFTRKRRVARKIAVCAQSEHASLYVRQRGARGGANAAQPTGPRLHSDEPRDRRDRVGVGDGWQSPDHGFDQPGMLEGRRGGQRIVQTSQLQLTEPDLLTGRKRPQDDRDAPASYIPHASRRPFEELQQRSQRLDADIWEHGGGHGGLGALSDGPGRPRRDAGRHHQPRRAREHRDGGQQSEPEGPQPEKGVGGAGRARLRDASGQVFRLKLVVAGGHGCCSIAPEQGPLALLRICRGHAAR
ncbi:MAG: hypothetical protein A4E73_00607 [Syntrophaceae bacterium PtaU1.Bin231]|nr:MAG: hypothetical protein A4E73_00607 [Syntrophaceae bacterium PtaU1.Bin231]